MHRLKEIGAWLCRLVLGGLFLFSGVSKAIDPMGTVYKLQDYFLSFGWSWPDFFFHAAAVGLSAFEFLLGGLLLLTIWKRSVLIITSVFLLPMTIFTLYLALYNPVSDCGCFGDAWMLTNWQTFLKNVVACLMLAYLIFGGDTQQRLFGKRTGRWSAYWILLFPMLLSLHAYVRLPMVDFRPYSIGTDLRAQTQLPATALQDSFVYRFIYERNGERREFSPDTIPSSDWIFVDREAVLVRKGDVPEIEGFQLLHADWGDVTQEVLSDTSFVFLLIAPDLLGANRSYMDRIVRSSQYARRMNYPYYLLTMSDPVMVDEFLYEYDVTAQVCSLDERTLKTMIRANPGLMLLKDGVVQKKWASIEVPMFEDNDIPLTDPLDASVESSEKYRVSGLLGLFFAFPLLLLYLMHTGQLIRLKMRYKRIKTTNINH